MFNKKPRRNFRQRKQSSSEDEEQRKAHVEENENVKASVVNASLKAAPGRGISCSSKREVTPPKADSSDEEHRENPELTEEKSKKNDGTNWKTKSVLSFSVEKENEESSFQLKRTSEKTVLFQSRKKEEASPARNTFNKGGGGGISSASPRHDHCDEALLQSPKHNSSSEDINSGDGNSEDSNGDDDEDVTNGGGVESSSATSESDSTCSAPKPIIIPNAKEIKAARKQRSAIRAQKEFISLRRDRPSSNGSTPDHYSREDEEERVDDDDDNEPDDHERRIEFAPRLKSIRERIAEKLGTSGESLDGSDEEEQELWEETQIEKGLKRRPGEQSPSGSDSSSNIRQDRVRNKKRSSRNKIPKSLPPVSVSTIKKRITGKLDSLKEVHRARQAELRRMAGDVENATASMELLEDVSSESQLKFYRNMTLYIHNLVECLQEKVVEINALEVELHTLLSDQMEALLAQTRERIKEQADRLQQLSYNTDEQSSSTVETDRKNNKDPKSEDCDLPEDAQLSPEEEEQLQTRIADIQSRSKDVFSDVQDDFCCVKNILARFEEWRRSYSESYHNAYISLCLPKLLNPIIRHQLLSWNPLQESSCGEFENHPWFSAVETFCHGHGHEELEHTDRQTLSSTIEKTVLPKMTAFVELVWDPMSHQQSASLSGVCHRLKEDYSIFQGEQSKPVKGFIEAVIQRLRNCVDEDVFIPLYPKRCLDDRSSPQCRFRDQQFWTGVKLLGNMGRWDLLLPEAVLKELMLDKLLNRYLMITLCSQTLSNTTSACKKIAESFPISWFEGDSQCLPQLQNFRNHIVQDVHRICKQQPPGDPDTKSAVIEDLKVLSRIRCYDSIMALAEKYHYQDAIYAHQLLNQESQ